MLADVVYIPMEFGIGDKMNGMTTAMWLAKQLYRPLKVCYPFLQSQIRLQTVPAHVCEGLTRGLQKKGEHRFWSVNTSTHYVGCKRCRNFHYVSREIRRTFWQNATFLHALNSSTRVVISLNRNVASVDGIQASRRLLHEAMFIQEPRYDVCIHHRSFRSQLTVDALLRCFPTADPAVVFTDYSSRHLVTDRKEPLTEGRSFSNDSHSFLELCRCREYMIPVSSFSIAAALASSAHLDKIMVYDNHNCSRKRLLRHAVTMFTPHL